MGRQDGCRPPPRRPEARWTRLGAKFTTFDDELGDVAFRATASIGGGRVAFGIIDYGEGTTFLVVPASGTSRPEDRIEAVLSALADAGVEPRDILERLPTMPAETNGDLAVHLDATARTN